MRSILIAVTTCALIGGTSLSVQAAPATTLSPGLSASTDIITIKSKKRMTKKQRMMMKKNQMDNNGMDNGMSSGSMNRGDMNGRSMNSNMGTGSNSMSR
jgi:hypothetical protein